ncbi:hypothetical protein JOD01_003897 [Brevibacillus fulvus]|uniref:Uncharacterized protein n=1 Tax=Brevibacillus fulvus TaxID=1125967 RepID=A0A938Y2R3_9BACL|nr:hypothetical protein [Brevibacillus fulvus]
MTPLSEEKWRPVLQECIVYDLLFKALMADKEKIGEAGLKLRYGPTLEKLSLLAEKQHHHFRRELGKLGCKILTRENRGGFYVVQCKVRGFIQEAIYWGEMLQSECEVRLLKLIGQENQL